MIDESARILELENQLQSVANYLRSLPAHPMTYKVLKETEAVLTKENQPTVMTGGIFAPSGILMLGAKVTGTTIILKTVLPQVEHLQQKHKDWFYSALLNGRKLHMIKDGETGIFGGQFFSLPDEN